MAKVKLSPAVKEADALEAAGKHQAAAATLQRAIRKQPKDAQALIRLVRLFNRQLRAPRQAAPLIKALISSAPKSALAHQLAAETHFNLGSISTAKDHADRSISLGNTSPDGLYVAATIYQKMKLFDATLSCLDKALKISPKHLQSRLLSASTLRTTGKQKEAEAICRQIFAEHPDNIHNLSIWSTVCKTKADDPIYLRLRDVIIPNLRQQKNPRLGAALGILGKLENDIGNFETAFALFAEGKDIRAPQHDRSINKTFVSTLVAGTSRADYFGAPGHSSEIPVLIVGMPRTGSTLMEQILSSHPQIGGIGESSLLRNIALDEGLKLQDGASTISVTRRLQPDRALALAGRYLTEARSENPDALRIVDKKLHNFEFLGLFAKLFPKARIIHALRDPMDNCVSCYMQRLKSYHSYTRDLTSLGQYYVEHRRLMDHWKQVLPNPIMNVSYEDMVADTEGMAREIIAFLGLEWDAACLEFRDNQQRVLTSSSWQVRQGIYDNSVKRWKRYESFLDPLKAELAEFYPDGFG